MRSSEPPGLSWMLPECCWLGTAPEHAAERRMLKCRAAEAAKGFQPGTSLTHPAERGMWGCRAAAAAAAAAGPPPPPVWRPTTELGREAEALAARLAHAGTGEAEAAVLMDLQVRKQLPALAATSPFPRC